MSSAAHGWAPGRAQEGEEGKHLAIPCLKSRVKCLQAWSRAFCPAAGPEIELDLRRAPSEHRRAGVRRATARGWALQPGLRMCPRSPQPPQASGTQDTFSCVVQGPSKPLRIPGLSPASAGQAGTLCPSWEDRQSRGGGFRGQEAIPCSIPLMSRWLSGQTPKSSRRPAKSQAILPRHLPPLHPKPLGQS